MKTKRQTLGAGAALACLLFFPGIAIAVPTISLSSSDGIFQNTNVGVLDTGFSAADIYRYSTALTSGQPPFATISNTALLAFSHFNDKTSFIFIADKINDGSGGEFKLELGPGRNGGGVQGAVIEVLDDPRYGHVGEGFFDVESGNRFVDNLFYQFQGETAVASFEWSPCCTDGFAITWEDDKLPGSLDLSVLRKRNIEQFLILSDIPGQNVFQYLDVSRVGDGVVLNFDFELAGEPGGMNGNGGTGGNAGGGAGGAEVPEPASLLLLLGGLLGTRARQMRTRS